MFRKVAVLLLVLVGWLSGVAVAQDLGGLPPLDPTGWGGSPFTFGAFLTLIIATLKRGAEGSALKKYNRVTSNPWLWRGVALALGVLGAFGLHLSKFGAELLLFGLVTPWTVLLFGIASGLVSMGYRDFLKSALGWIGQATPQSAILPSSAEIQPPAGLKRAPPSGLEPIPGLDGVRLPGAQGFLGGGLMALTLDVLLTQILKGAGLEGTPAQLARIGARLVQVAPDLLDGNAHLNADSRNVILGVVLDLKKTGDLI